jgi:adenylosuccinate lyase
VASAIPNVLSGRYASVAMNGIWSPAAKIVLERRLWIAVMTAQSELGVSIPAAAIADYESVLEQVDLQSISDRERVTKHDVKARIEEFNGLAGHEFIHLGMTSRDLTENVEQLQIREALALVREKSVAALARLACLAAQYSDTAITGRSHNVPAQTTTLGKRFASAADELLTAYARIDELLARYPLRGIKGPVGTAQDMLDLLDGDAAKLQTLEEDVAGTSDSLTCLRASDRSTRARSTSMWSPPLFRRRQRRRVWPPRSASWPASTSSLRASDQGRLDPPRCHTR